MKKTRDRALVVVVAATLSVTLLLSWACGGSNEPETVQPPAQQATQPPAEEATKDPAEAIADPEETIGGVLTAIDLIDTVGFHDMATELAEATELSPRYASRVGNVLAATKAAAWPAELQEPVDAFVADAEAFKAALDSEDLAASATAAEPIHDTQHDLSNATYEWLDGQARTLVSISAHGQMAISMAAIDIVDSSEFHDMATELAEATEINPRYAGKVGKALTAAQVAVWAEETHEQLNAMVADLETLKAALEAEDLEGARTASEAVHDSQHDFSNAVYAWLETQDAMTYEPGAMITVCNLKAQDLIDSAGFHDMATDIAEATEINPRWGSKVGKILAVTEVAQWSEESHEAVDVFMTDLEALLTALDANDLEGARTASEAVHDSQHELSEGTYAWVSSMPMMGGN